MKKTLPLESTVRPEGWSSIAFVAGPRSPVKPAGPVPAIVEIVAAITSRASSASSRSDGRLARTAPSGRDRPALRVEETRCRRVLNMGRYLFLAGGRWRGPGWRGGHAGAAHHCYGAPPAL